MDISELISTARVLMANKTQELGKAVITRQDQARYIEKPTEFEGRTKSFRTYSGHPRARICCAIVKTRQDSNQPVSDVARQCIL